MWSPVPAYSLTAALLLALAGGTHFTASAEQANSAAAHLVEQDQLFVSAASTSSLAEIQLSQLAMKKAQDGEVKNFAERLVEDHRRMSDELTSILDDMNIDVADELSAQAKSRLDRLSRLSGQAFDREYMKLMVTSHDKAVATFGDESEAGQSEPLKKFAATHLPTLKQHLDRALTLDGKMSVATQTPPTDPLQSQGEARKDAAELEQGKPIAQRTAADLAELPVLTQDGDMLGTIKEIVLDQSTGTVYAVIPVDGDLGAAWSIGDKDIAVDCRNLRANPENDPRGSLIVAASEEELKSRPAIDISQKQFVRYPDDRTLGELGRF